MGSPFGPFFEHTRIYGRVKKGRWEVRWEAPLARDPIYVYKGNGEISHQIRADANATWPKSRKGERETPFSLSLSFLSGTFSSFLFACSSLENRSSWFPFFKNIQEKPSSSILAKSFVLLWPTTHSLFFALQERKKQQAEPPPPQSSCTKENGLLEPGNYIYTRLPRCTYTTFENLLHSTHTHALWDFCSFSSSLGVDLFFCVEKQSNELETQVEDERRRLIKMEKEKRVEAGMRVSVYKWERFVLR